MAKINISFDTNTKECSVTKDGVEIPNVNYATVSKYGSDSYLNITQESEEEDGMVTYTNTSAEKREEFKASAKNLFFNK